MDSPCIYAEAKQIRNPDLQDVSPGPETDGDAESTGSSTELEDPLKNHVPIVIHLTKKPERICINPLKRPNQKIDFCYTNFKALDVIEFDEVVKQNVAYALKEFQSLVGYWSKKFYEYRKESDRRLAETKRDHEKDIVELKKDLHKKNEYIKAKEKEFKDMVEDQISKDSENQKIKEMLKYFKDGASFLKFMNDKKLLDEKVAALQKQLSHEKAESERYKKNYDQYKGFWKAADAEKKVLQQCVDSKKAENITLSEKNIQIDEDLKAAQKACADKDEKLYDMRLDCDKELRELQTQIATLTKENDDFKADMQISSQKYDVLNAAFDDVKLKAVETERFLKIKLIETKNKTIAIQKTHKNAVKELKATAAQQKNALNAEISRLKLEIKAANKSLNDSDELRCAAGLKMEMEKRELTEKCEAFEEKAKKMEEENAQEKAKIQGELEETLKELEAAKTENEILQTKIADLEKNVLDVAIDDNESGLDKLENQISEASGPAETDEDGKAAEELNVIKAQYADLYEDHTELQRATNLLKSEYNQIQQKLKEFEATNAELHKNLNALENLHGSSSSPLLHQRKSINGGRKSLDQIFNLSSNNEFHQNGGGHLQNQQEIEKLQALLQQEKDSSLLRQAILLQENSNHLQEKKQWVVLFNTFTAKYQILENENLKLNAALKYFRNIFSGGGSSNQEVVIPTKRKRKHPPTDPPLQINHDQQQLVQQQVQQQQPQQQQLSQNLTDCNNNNNNNNNANANGIVYYSAFNNNNQICQ